MNKDLIKQAYAYGAAIALQELGFNSQQAEEGGVKLAEEMDDSRFRNGSALGRVGIGALGGGLAGGLMSGE